MHLIFITSSETWAKLVEAMNRQDEILQLRKYPHHYLWDIPRIDWTDDDLENLKNPEEMKGVQTKRKYVKDTNKEADEVAFVPAAKKEKKRKTTKPYLTEVVFTKNGVSQNFKSVVQASQITGEPVGNIYPFITGIRTPKDGSTWKKALIEN